MNRREFITLLGGAAAWPLVARAQRTAMPVIGFLSSRSPGESASVVAAFRQGLRETGFVEGRNLAIAFRWADGRYDSLPPLAAELIDLPVTLIFAAGGPPTAFAVKAATSTIPIVFSAVSDPVEIGLVPSLNQPGGNITGMAVFNATLAGKRIELTKELIPTADIIGYLLNPADRRHRLRARRERPRHRAATIWDAPRIARCAKAWPRRDIRRALTSRSNTAGWRACNGHTTGRDQSLYDTNHAAISD
jgi:putative tryptophan/tyrosine transport system substrate-binding protein